MKVVNCTTMDWGTKTHVTTLHILGDSNITVADLCHMTKLEELIIEVPEAMAYDEALKLSTIRNGDQSPWPHLKMLGYKCGDTVHRFTTK